jgi:C1A family cysteine protease
VPKSAKQLLTALATIGPIALHVDASSNAFQMYTTGVVNTPSCFSQINHGVTGVGYGVEKGQKYYIIRNSWGTKWGDKGYIKIAAIGE